MAQIMESGARYLEFCTWEEIAVDLHYCVRTVQRIHVKALEVVQGILNEGNESEKTG